MDVVDASNLQRQILHNIDRIGERKVDSAKKTLTALNPDVDVVTYDVRFGADNVLDIIDGYDVILDGTDNFPTRYLLNDASLLEAHPRRARLDLPLRGPGHGVRPVQRARATAACSPSRRRPSSRRRCAEAGVLGVLPGIVGSIQALEAIKLLLDLGDPLVGRLLAYDALERDVPHLQGAARPARARPAARTRHDRDRRVRRALHAPRRARRRQRTNYGRICPSVGPAAPT